MGTRSDFVVIHFFKCLGDTQDCFGKPGFPFVGDKAEVSFTIAGVPAGQQGGEDEVRGFLIINTFDVNEQTHRVKLNGIDLPGTELMPHPPGAARCWQTRMMSFIQKDMKLTSGKNTLRIERDNTTTDNFLVGDVVVHWRERD